MKNLKNTGIFLFLAVFGVIISISYFSNDYSSLNKLSNDSKRLVIDWINKIKPKQNIEDDTKSDELIIEEITKCTTKEKIKLDDKVVEPGLRKISQLQEYCESFATNTQMIFIDMPNSEVAASRLGLKVSKTLKEYSKYGVKPIVVIEPVTDWGLVDFQEFNEGLYTPWINSFFVRLKGEGITDEQMGMWVPFPEANLPYWNKNDTEPNIFGKNVNIYAKILKTHFPQTEVSILLNSVSYPSLDENWENGKYVSLIPYLSDLDKTLITSFGIQGFPWRSPTTTKNPVYIYDPSEFLNKEIIVEAANFLNVKNIWINTGTFRSKYSNNPEQLVTVNAKDRGDILNAILLEAVQLRDSGLKISIHLFSENKSETPEATDWSYFSKDSTPNDNNIYILKEFIYKADQEDIDFWYFDR